MRWLVFKVVFGVVMAAYMVILVKPAFYLKALDKPSTQMVIFELGTPSKQRVNDKLQTELIYRAGSIRPLCVEYVLTFPSNGILQDWTWSILCE
jgi:hypothetical protein